MPLICGIMPPGRFFVAVHEPSFTADNVRRKTSIESLGLLNNGPAVYNHANFPLEDVHVSSAHPVYEIPNAFFFRGTTFIDSSWADARAGKPESFALSGPPTCSWHAAWRAMSAREGVNVADTVAALQCLPRPMLLALAVTSTDPLDLRALATLACELVELCETSMPGLAYAPDRKGVPRPVIHDHELFEAVGNNPHLEDALKQALVLRPGAQGTSEIVGDYHRDQTHIYEYLRRNSYIPWGHYAANFAEDAVRYRPGELSLEDLRGLRHLYYRRVFLRLARECALSLPEDVDDVETLRRTVLDALTDAPPPFSGSTLWGWNFGFDFAPSGYRLHASHQQIHQQNAMTPNAFSTKGAAEDGIRPFACGLLVEQAVNAYREEHDRSLFADYRTAIVENTRTDNGPGPAALEIFADDNVVLFAPKAQTSQWELQLFTKGRVGNVLEAETAVRDSLDLAMYTAFRCLTALGATMITSIEYAKRFDAPNDLDQRLLYSFLPKLPWSPGGFSEAQLRFVCGHYPEDFAAACRTVLRR